MEKRGRKKGVKNGCTPAKDACEYCEGTTSHWGKPCGACDGTGSENVRKQIQKVYEAKVKLANNLNPTP